jgi:hypothetical protein
VATIQPIAEYSLVCAPQNKFTNPARSKNYQSPQMPHNGRTETVGFGRNCRVRHHKPFSLNADTIMALLGVPVDVLHTDTVSKSAAQSVSTPKMLEPFLKRRIGEAAIVTRV